LRPSRQLWAMKESGEGGMFAVTPTEAEKLNKDLYAIYWGVNDFHGRRMTENLARINSWYFEFDDLPKDEQWKRLEASPVIPSLVVESFAGYQVYFDAIGATKNNYREIEERLIQHFKSDPRPKDLTRVLRAPGYLHQKKTENPFLVSIKFQSEFKYTERMMLYLFEEVHKPDVPEVDRVNYKPPQEDTLTEFLNKLDCERALEALSGHWGVNFECYNFKGVTGGKKNILVNGKSTSCFIDHNKKIGATPGGPTVWQWLKYYGHDAKTIYKILGEVFGYGTKS
jgi:hypothetical protein